jgi:hypothetical protein
VWSFSGQGWIKYAVLNNGADFQAGSPGAWLGPNNGMWANVPVRGDADRCVQCGLSYGYTTGPNGEMIEEVIGTSRRYPTLEAGTLSVPRFLGFGRLLSYSDAVLSVGRVAGRAPISPQAPLFSRLLPGTPVDVTKGIASTNIALERSFLRYTRNGIGWLGLSIDAYDASFSDDPRQRAHGMVGVIIGACALFCIPPADIAAGLTLAADGIILGGTWEGL